MAATPPGVADVLRGFCQQDAPPGEYTLAGFDRRLEMLVATQQQLEAAGDHRGVFHLTYLAFSRQVRQAFDDNRFTDPAFAADMSCRFVDAYLEQAQRWESGDPTQCRAWRLAFGGAESGEANVLQSMFLGMNAHIHYDLAFVTLGSCRAFGDLETAAATGPSLSMSGVPDARHLDFLVINQIAWESIPIIQDAVLGAFAEPLKWGNKLVGGITSTLGQRLLMGARDAAWAQTNLLVHARDERSRGAIAAMIDAYAASHTHLVETLSPNPLDVVGGVRKWRGRRDAQAWGDEVLLPDATRDALMDLALHDPVVAELALRQLAFAGYDPAWVLDALVKDGRTDLAAEFVPLVGTHAPADRRDDLERYLETPGSGPVAVVEAALAEGYVTAKALPDEAVDRVVERCQRSAVDADRCLAVPAVAAVPELAGALRAHRERAQMLLERADARVPATGGPALTEAQAHALLVVHPDPWVRLCASRVSSTGDDNMSELIDRVLFLKTTPVFMEVEAGALLAVAEELQPMTFEPGEAILRESEPSNGVHLVAEGMVAVVQDHNGSPVKVADVGPGGALGELSALNGTPAVATCHAVVQTKTLFLPTAVLARLLHQHPRVSIGLLRHLGQRLEATTQMALKRQYGT